MKEPKRIGFYSTRGEYGCFSNFSQHRVVIDGKLFLTTEHFFQSQKFAGSKYEEKVREVFGPKEAAKLGRNRKFPLRKDWETAKDNVMRQALRAKFTQHEKCRETLLGTGDDLLFENSPVDYYWGVGKRGNGKNRLGMLLMELRTKLRAEERLEANALVGWENEGGANT